MKLMVDTFDPEKLKKVVDWGVVHGVTMNPRTVAREKREAKDLLKNLKEICSLVNGPVLCQVVTDSPEMMIEEAKVLAEVSPQIHVKIPAGNPTCTTVIHRLHDLKIKTAATVIYNPVQAFLAASAGATLVACFQHALEAVTSVTGEVGTSNRINILRPVRAMLDRSGFKTKLVACTDSPVHITEAAVAGADYATIRIEFFPDLYDDLHTSNRQRIFIESWTEVYGDLNWLSPEIRSGG
jgi:transaldolase